MRAVLVVAATAVLVTAALLTIRTQPTARLPSWVPTELSGFEIRPGAVADMSAGQDVAVGVVRRSVFLRDAPESEPEVFPTLVSGRIARYPIQASSSGQVVVPFERDAPAWLVVWRGLDGTTLDRFGEWPGSVDAVFLVDGQTADCCWVTLFLTGGARLG